MEKRLLRWELSAALFTAVLGTLLHFTYQWSGELPLVGAFSAVNESVWEHTKLVFVPLFLEFFVHARYLGSTWPNLPAARAAACLLGVFLIISGFYTYTGIFGTHALWADILLFLLAVAAACLTEWLLLRNGALSHLWMQVAGLLVLWGMAFVFVWCTFHPPHIALFLDTTNGQFGI